MESYPILILFIILFILTEVCLSTIGISSFKHNVWAQTIPLPSTPTVPKTTIFSSSTELGTGLGDMQVQQGVITSSVDPLPGHDTHQSATILDLRNDNAVYAGTITFTATKPVEVQVLHRNMTTEELSTIDIPEEFGELNISQLLGNNGTITVSNIIPPFSEDTETFDASVPFSGNAVALHNLEGEPFAATYTVTAGIVGAADRADEIGPAPADPEEQEEEEEED